MTIEERQLLKRIEHHLAKLVTESNGKFCTSSSDTQSSSLSQDELLKSGTHSASSNMRVVEIVTFTGSPPQMLLIEITKSDGSIITLQMVHNGNLSYESGMNEAPIAEVIVTNTGGSSVTVILNVTSKK